MNVRLVFAEDERSGILATLEVGVQSTTAALCTCIEGFKAHRGLLPAWASTWISLRKTSYGAFWSVLAEEFLIRQRRVVELVVIILGPVEELAVRWVHLVIVLGELHVEIGNPAELTVDVTLLRQLCVVWHSSALHLVLLIWVELPLRVQ